MTPQQEKVRDLRQQLDEIGALAGLGFAGDEYSTFATWLQANGWQVEAVLERVRAALVSAREADDPRRYLHAAVTRRRTGSSTPAPPADWSRRVRELEGGEES